MAKTNSPKKGQGSNGTATATATEKRRRGLSAESRLKLSLNDVLDAAKEGTLTVDSPEYAQATTLLESLGFETRKSSSAKILELQEELKNIDITAADSQTRINDISKEIGKLRRV